jgi:YHS domain-containing protein
MFRILFLLLTTVFLITILRSVIGVVMRGLSQLVNPKPAPKHAPPESDPVPLSGELKKDPACGTYISAATSIQQSVAGQTFYFCSAQCRDKYVASLAR